MLLANPSEFCNMLIFGSKKCANVLGGLCVTDGITNANLYSRVEIFVSISNPWYLNDDSEDVVTRDGQHLEPRNYFVLTDGRCSIM